MTTHIEAMKQWLSAIERVNEIDGMYSWKDEKDSLRQAIATEESSAAQEPVVWRELCRRLYIELFYCDQQMTSTRDEDGEPVWKTGSTVRDVLADAKQALDTHQQPKE